MNALSDFAAGIHLLSRADWMISSRASWPSSDSFPAACNRPSSVADCSSKSVRLVVDALQEGQIHELHADGVRSTDDEGLLHAQAYYTLNYLPQ